MKLLEPIKIGNVTLKNRIMFPPLTTGYEARDGSITPQSTAFYSRLAEGGVGYIVLGDVAPIPTVSPTPKLFDDSQIESFRLLADGIHKYGAKLAIQIFHPEYDTVELARLFNLGDMAAARAKMHHDMEHFVDEVTVETLHDIIQKMCDCAVRAEKAGVDIIEVHGDRLVGALSSTILNHRTDEYGGCLENRARFGLEFVKALKKAVPNMPIDYKFPIVTQGRGRGGVSVDDALIMAKWLENVGVDMIHVAQANHTSNLADTIPPMGVQPYGYFLEITEQVKKQVSIPVSAVGRIFTPQFAESILETGKADIVALGRPLLADPDWANKVAAGDFDSIRQCICCNKGCTDKIQERAFLSCVLNAENGFELTRKITPAAKIKNVVVVGGGPAGMEAARVAALKGHKVTLFEEQTTLGGQLHIASVPPRKSEMRRATSYLTNAVQNVGIDLKIGHKVTEKELLAMKPDAVIVACGASSFSPNIEGKNRSNVFDAWDILSGKEQVYGKVAVIGGGFVGIEVSEYLAVVEGRPISIIEMLDAIAIGESNTIKPTMFENFDKFGVQMYPSHKVKSIELDAVICENKDKGEVRIPCDCVVLAIGVRPVLFDCSELEKNGIAVVKVGDCGEAASDIEHAIKTAYDAANSL